MMGNADQYTLGVDIGTFETKGVLVDRRGKVVAQAARPHKMLVPRPGWAEHRPDEDWWGDFVFVTKALLAQSGVDPGDIACVATSAIGPCMLPVDSAGRPLMNGVLYGVDTRASEEIAILNRQIGEAAIMAACGNALTSQSVGPKILWLKRNHPDIFARTARVLTSTSYLTFRLTGDCVIDHYTAANFSPLYDVNRLDWTSDLAPDILPLHKLPRLMWSSDIAGRVTAQAAAETGLAPGTPVTCGTIDAAAEAVSVGVAAPGDMMMMYGSTIFIIALTDRPTRDARLWYAPWLFPGQHASMAGLATSGTLTHWFRDHLAREIPADTAWETLAAEAAASPPGANGLIFLPYFSGERTPLHDPLAKGAIFGLNLTHTRGDLYRAALEGIAFATRHVIETYAETGQRDLRIRAVGGGTKNRLWLQTASDAGGLPQEVCARTIGASYGDAFLAALAIGTAKADDIHHWNPVSETVVPHPSRVLDARYAQFRRLYETTKDLAHDMGSG
jgi:xylulokinase